jgi:DNA replication protein DnaC
MGHPSFGKLEICVCRQRDVSQQVRERLYSLSRLDELKGLTFETFEPRGRKGLGEIQANSLEMAFNQAQHYSGNLKGWLLLQGDYGCGKTHLAAAIANFAVNMGVPTLFLTVPDLLDMLRFSYDSDDTTFEERFNEIRNASLLILDDFGTQNATNWAQEKLFQIINYRYINKLPLVVTTNLSLDEIDERIRSRLADPELVSKCRINAPDYRRPEKSEHPEISALGLTRLSKCSFGNFSLRRKTGLSKADEQSLEKAFKATQQYAENPKGWLVLTGPNGCGKTHLAAAIGNYQVGLGSQVILETVPNLLDHLRATFGPDSLIRYDQRFNEIRNVNLLILDDMITQSMTPWAREKLYQLFDYRFNDEKPTVITTAEKVENMDARIRSRLLNRDVCRIYAITAPNYAPLDK